MKFLERETRGIEKEGDGSWESEVSGREMSGHSEKGRCECVVVKKRNKREKEGNVWLRSFWNCFLLENLLCLKLFN